MTLREFLEILATGELRNLSVTNGPDKNKIRDADQNMIVNYINQGLTNLFSKFILLEKELLLETQQFNTRYYLRNQYAKSNNNFHGFKYIDDSNCEPFSNDLLKILAVYDENGNELFLNDIEQPNSVFTIQHDVLQITNIHWNKIFSIVYQASHKKLRSSEPETEIEIPDFFEEALQSYVASKVLSHMNGEGNTAKATEYMSRYEYLCADAESKDLATTSLSTTNSKLQRRGFP